MSDIAFHECALSMNVLCSSVAAHGVVWVWPVCATAVLLLAAVWSWSAGPGGVWKYLCVLLRAAGVLVLLFCLLDMRRSVSRVRPGANIIALVADNSSGMQVRDRGESLSRGQLMQALLDPNAAGWLGELTQQFELRRFIFDSRVQAVGDFAAMPFDGCASDIGAALREIPQRLAGRPVAGIILFTDGIATDHAESVVSEERLPPVYPVMMGRVGGIRDLAISQAQSSQTAFEDAPVSVRAEVGAVGCRGEEVIARLIDEDGRPLMELAQRVRKDPETLAFMFRWGPARPGLSFCTLQIGIRDELESADQRQNTTEATLLNNVQTIPVERSSGPYRVLYVAGRPNWEYKFLKRALDVDDQIHLVGLLRVARREPRLSFLGRAGETGNPLFRGFGDQSRESTERYDQPVLLRLDTRDEHELGSGFPRSADDLYGYDAVILDDIEADFFGADQTGLLRSFVGERGGGLLMLAGEDSFREGGWSRTALAPVLPVYLDRAVGPDPVGPFHLRLTREGWLEPWARIRDNEIEEQSRRSDMPPFQVLSSVGGLKPGATPVAVATDTHDREYPAMAIQRFGRGRAAAIMIGDIWRWGMRNADTRRDMEKAWRQIVRWLTADVPRRVELAAIRASGKPPATVTLETRVRNARFEPVDDATVALAIRHVPARLHLSSTNTADQVEIVTLRAEPSESETGLYTALFTARASGTYHATVSVTNAVGADLGRAETAWTADPAGDEFRSLQPNLQLLAAIAKRTGGEVVGPDQLGALGHRLPAAPAPVMESVVKPIWHTPWIFAVALACFLAEWGLRRTRGMP